MEIKNKFGSGLLMGVLSCFTIQYVTAIVFHLFDIKLLDLYLIKPFESTSNSILLYIGGAFLIVFSVLGWLSYYKNVKKRK